MRAVTITEANQLTWTEVPDPELGPGEVIVDIAATAVNRADIMQRQGLYPPPKGAPPYPGLECSGRIAQMADDVTGWHVGQEVCALLAGGGYAQKVAVPAVQLLPKPETATLNEAGGLPEVACTVWSNMVDLARLKSGETVLIHGGGSGIGTFAIQLAKALGATVITTARKAKHEALRGLGADRTIDYTTEDFTEGTTADVILDIMGAPYLAGNVKVLADGGRLVVIGLQGGRKAELDLGALLAKRATVAATALRSRPVSQKATIIQGVLREVWPLIDNGAIRPVVDRALPMSEAAEAHRIVEAGEHLGKVVLLNPAAA